GASAAADCPCRPATWLCAITNAIAPKSRAVFRLTRVRTTSAVLRTAAKTIKKRTSVSTRTRSAALIRHPPRETSQKVGKRGVESRRQTSLGRISQLALTTPSDSGLYGGRVIGPSDRVSVSPTRE